VPSTGFDAKGKTEQLQDGVRDHDRELLDELVSEGFALVSGRSLGRLGKDDWIAAALQVDWTRFVVAIKRVIELNDVAIVDYDVEQEMASAPNWAPDAPLRTRWVTTDVWVLKAGQWRLLCRHPELVP
jgi:hypothetical protein